MMRKNHNNARERILKETAGLVQLKGFRSTSVADVLKATGLQKGGLYHHFSGKEAVGLSVLEQQRQEFMDFLDEALQGSCPAASLDHFLEAAFQKHSKTGFRGGCFFGNAALEMADAEGPFAGAVQQIFDDWSAKLAAVIREGQRDGSMCSDMVAPVLARQVIMVLEGGIMLSRLSKKPAPLHEAIGMIRDTLFTERKDDV